MCVLSPEKYSKYENSTVGLLTSMELIINYLTANSWNIIEILKIVVRCYREILRTLDPSCLW